jgi:hypothetical protein
MKVTRRKLIIAGGVAIAGGPLIAIAQTQSSVPERPPALPPALVNQFVLKAHTDLAATKTMLTDEPMLLNATWDWAAATSKPASGAPDTWDIGRSPNS